MKKREMVRCFADKAIFRAVFSPDGGIDAWQQAGLSVDTVQLDK